jgi:sulfur-carrier protein
VPTVTLRYWASLRAAAGLTEESVQADTLAVALAQARARHADAPRFTTVLSVCSAIVDGAPVGLRDQAELVLTEGSVVELLPPFAGG